MSVNYIIADSLARIKNAQSSRIRCVELEYSKFLLDCLFLLKKEGYIGDFYSKEIRPGVHKIFVVLRYYNSSGVISSIKIFSRPGRRLYRRSADLERYFNGLGVLILSTSKGIMSAKKAIGMNCGGELLFGVY